MAVNIARLPQGTRVRVRQGKAPQDPALIGRDGTVVLASEYRPNMLGVVLDGEEMARYFAIDELEAEARPPTPPERDAARQRRALP